jgi:hypothetical protein
MRRLCIGNRKNGMGLGNMYHERDDAIAKYKSTVYEHDVGDIVAE